jgi:hypothetical protein
MRMIKWKQEEASHLEVEGDDCRIIWNIDIKAISLAVFSEFLNVLGINNFR